MLHVKCCMKLIVGLGNPGEQYKNNRHNVGFMFVDYLLTQLTDSRINGFKSDKYLSSEVCHIPSEIILTKPTTFMNRSGEAINSCVTRYMLHVTYDLIVVHDDLDIPLGKFKIQKGIGPKLHNGIASIEQHLKTKDFLRVRIGVDSRTPENHIDGESYVLQNFLPEEKTIIQRLFSEIYNRLTS